MELQAVAAAIYEKHGVPQCSVTTVGGAQRDHIRVKHTQEDRFDPQNEAETLEQYERLMAAIHTAGQAQYAQNPRQRLMVVIGCPSDLPVSIVTYHALRRFRAVIGERADTLRAEITDAPNPVEDFKVLVAGMHMEVNAIRAAHSAAVTMIPRVFIDHSANVDPDWQPGIREQHFLEMLNLLCGAAEAGKPETLEMLQDEAVAMGRRFAVEAHLSEYDESRFLRPHPRQVVGLDRLRLFDLRARFAKGIREITGWNFNMCIKLPGDDANPPFSDVAGCFLADQLDQENRIHTPGVVLVKR